MGENRRSGKKERMNIDLTPEAQKAVNALKDEMMIDKKNLTSKLLIWFYQQDQMRRLEILGLIRSKR